MFDEATSEEWVAAGSALLAMIGVAWRVFLSIRRRQVPTGAQLEQLADATKVLADAVHGLLTADETPVNDHKADPANKAI